MKRTVEIEDTLNERVDDAINSEIEDTWYLYSSELEEAYENAGIGSNPRESNGMAAIYFYIQQKVYDWIYDKGEDVFFDWVEEKTKELDF